MGRRPADLSGRKFGMLTAKYATEKRDKRGGAPFIGIVSVIAEMKLT